MGVQAAHMSPHTYTGKHVHTFITVTCGMPQSQPEITTYIVLVEPFFLWEREHVLSGLRRVTQHGVSKQLSEEETQLIHHNCNIV